jgi:hypothetical protein
VVCNRDLSESNFRTPMRESIPYESAIVGERTGYPAKVEI